MTSESKILTVSYGTFSCTLEGFDNPFDTMKAIAEYFRDLAAQDRHFGAEPPPPDAAMLHRLAEREVSRLAAASQQDAARLTPAPEPATSPRIQINPVSRRPAHPPVEAEPVALDGTAAPEPSLQEVIPDGVAAKLARIRNAVHPAAPAADHLVSEPAVADDAAVTDFALDGQDEDLVAPLADDLTLAADLAEAAPTDLATDAEAVVARLGALIADGVVAPADADEVEDATPESEVALADVWTETAGEFEAAPPVEQDAALADTVADLPSLDDLDAVADAGHMVEAFAEDELTTDDVALLAQLDGTVFDEDSLAAKLDDTLPEDQPADLDLEDAARLDPLPEYTEAATSSEVLPEEFVVEAAVDLTVAEAPVVDEPVAADLVAEEAVALDPEEPALPTGKAGSRARRVNSRVVRIHPSEEVPDSANRDPAATRKLDSDDAGEIARLMKQAEEVMAEDENRRRQEALSRLKAAVVATAADRADIDYEAPKAEVKLDPYRDDLAEAIQPEAAPEPQPEPEVKPRRKSVPIRPAEPRPGTIRPGMISPPPLVLVSEQRIDRVPPPIPPAPAPAPAPVAAPAAATAPASIAPSMPEGQPMVALRTGRLTGAIGAGAAVAASSAPARNLVLEKPSYGTAAVVEDDEDLGEDSKEINEAGLASFAELVGARSMAEMLEAAAAYATCVENRSQFTRPQLMRRMMASAGGKPVSREDGLRSFGTLLRTGRIEKVTRGHYSLAENSPYLAEARRLT